MSIQLFHTSLSVLNCLYTFAKNKLTIFVWILYFVPLICMFIFSPIPHCLEYWQLHSKLKSGSVSFLTLFLFFKTVLPFLLPFYYINFRFSLSVSKRNPTDIWTRIVLNLQISWKRMEISTRMSLPTHEYDIYLHLCWYSLVSFIGIL